MSKVIEITSESDFQAHIASLSPSTLLIISFHAPWAPPCAHRATVLATLASEYPAGPSTGNGTNTTTASAADEPQPSATPTSWISVNAEELTDVAEQFNVSSVPFLALVRNGVTIETVAETDAVKVREAIERHASKPATTSSAPHKSGSDGTTTAATDTGADKERLFKRLDGLVQAAPVMLFMKGTPDEPKCGFSRQLVSLLRQNKVRYGFFNILADDEVRQGLKEYADWPTFPQLWMDGELVGGLDIVKESLENDSAFLDKYKVAAAKG